MLQVPIFLLPFWQHRDTQARVQILLIIFCNFSKNYCRALLNGTQNVVRMQKDSGKAKPE